MSTSPPVPSAPTRVIVHQHCWARGEGSGPTPEFPESRSFELEPGTHRFDSGTARGASNWNGMDASSLYFDPASVSVTITNAAGQTIEVTRPGKCLQDFDETRPFDNTIREITITPKTASPSFPFSIPTFSDIFSGGSSSSSSPTSPSLPSSDSSFGDSGGEDDRDGGGGGGDGGGSGGDNRHMMIALAAAAACVCMLSCCASMALAVSGSGGSSSRSASYDSSYDSSY